MSDLNLKEQLAGRDIVIIIATEQNFGQLGFGFIDRAYRLFHPMTPADYAAIDRLTKEYEKKASWEEMHNDDLFIQHMHQKAEADYDHTHE